MNFAPKQLPDFDACGVFCQLIEKPVNLVSDHRVHLDGLMREDSSTLSHRLCR